MVTTEYMNFTCESDLKGPDSSELPPFDEPMLGCLRARSHAIEQHHLRHRLLTQASKRPVQPSKSF
jgi:hypothetical protein